MRRGRAETGPGDGAPGRGAESSTSYTASASCGRRIRVASPRARSQSMVWCSMMTLTSKRSSAKGALGGVGILASLR